MLPPVFATLKLSNAVKAIVGTNPPRIYRHGAAPQTTDKPYVTWFVLNAAPENNLTSTPPIDRYTVQVDCWHQTDSGIETLAEAVRDAIEPYAHMTAMPINQRELADTKLFRIALQFDWFVARANVFEQGVPFFSLGLSGDQDSGVLLLSGDMTDGNDTLVVQRNG